MRLILRALGGLCVAKLNTVLVQPGPKRLSGNQAGIDARQATRFSIRAAQR